MSSFGPLQKLSFTAVALGAFTRICTLPALSTRGYSAPHTLVSDGLNPSVSWARVEKAVRRSNVRIDSSFKNGLRVTCRFFARAAESLHQNRIERANGTFDFVLSHALAASGRRLCILRAPSTCPSFIGL